MYVIEYRERNREKIKNYKKQYMRKRRESNIHFKLFCNIRARTNKAFKSQNVRKTNTTFDLLGCSHLFFKSRIIHQFYGNMTIENYGSGWQIDHFLSIASFNLLDENDMKKCFNWINLRPIYVKDNIIKGDKIDYHLYLIQEVKAKYFMKLNAQEEQYKNIH